jgi:2-oxoglutarate dehydrogenase E2 component (dihydrolipoamide succinyltransferase)
MPIELRIPAIGESITEVEIGVWLKTQGQTVTKDEPVVTLESEKATVDLPAPDSGILSEILKQKGATAKVGEVIAYMEKDGGSQALRTKGMQPKTDAPNVESSSSGSRKGPSVSDPVARPTEDSTGNKTSVEPRVMPAAARVMAERGIHSDDIQPTGPGGRLLKEDVLRSSKSEDETKGRPAPARPEPETSTVMLKKPAPAADRQEETVPMTMLRRTVAERLVQAQHSAALLTTFNEADMSAVIGLRKQYAEEFQQKYNVKLGFMSFFVKAAIDALKQFPTVNAEVRGTNIIYHNYFDIGVAIGGGKGLVVPVLKNAERMSFAEVEIAIGDFARRAKENKLKIEELQGGTFTISNGGVYGSLLSTPIVNPPQSGVLGMHSIQERPVAHEGNVVIRPMMYLALTYDHRLVDGREGVGFLKRIKEVIENPARMLMEV